MRSMLINRVLCFIFLGYLTSYGQTGTEKESRKDYESRMQWWNEARFGLFIHWGLYSIPAGEWNGSTDHAEWIRTTAQIPLEEYDKLVRQFNPDKFNAEEWVRMAREAGMNYIVITSKHHDGFCLFDSKFTDFDVMSTPFKRDILQELSDACRKQGIKLCFYYSIMDWHHPDYLPRRDWETTRSSGNADFHRYIEYMKNQLREIVTTYGDIGVLWFDGNWDGNWDNNQGDDLYRYVRTLSPQIIVNDRVGKQSGLTYSESDIVGDYRTPEQTIPSTGLPGIFWETCMTMNDHWGYNSHDNNWKSSGELIQRLADIASKGGNFLLNVGPTAAGIFPDSSVNRLREIGKWMKVNGESIYGTSASPFNRLLWGRCAKKEIGDDTRLFLHVFEYPIEGALRVPGIANIPKGAFLLADQTHTPLTVSRDEDALVIQLQPKSPESFDEVVVLDIIGKPDIVEPPLIISSYQIFIHEIDVAMQVGNTRGEVFYTLDGAIPTIHSTKAVGAFQLNNTMKVSARWFRDGKPISETASKIFTKVIPQPSIKVENITNGIRYKFYEGDWNVLPDFTHLKAAKSGVLSNFELTPRTQEEHFAFEFSGFINIESEDVYSFFTNSDDGSQLFIGDTLVVDNDQLHPMQEKAGVIALAAGFHPLRVTFFEKTGGNDLIISMSSLHNQKIVIPNHSLFMKVQE